MKLLITLFCLFITSYAFSQQPTEGLNFQIKKKYSIPNFDTSTFKIEMMKRFQEMRSNSYAVSTVPINLKTKYGSVQYLPDGMACIIPDMENFKVMPNIGLRPEVKLTLLLGGMPNLFKGIIIPKSH